MKKKLLLASTLIFLGIICIISFHMIGSKVEPDGTLVEPFFLVPLSILLVFSGITALLLMAIISVVKKSRK
ncbi:DUF3955 domain-containing protein [Bacillus norwichensis]|uniref:DUF3955 domain-containing protein n=1 Tax=Bacillus norwichensis TaxID=2762217 RepID=A0ABR8VR68_9BACI|nr:DUF3955 domain-containing protein [Bacillus norwichensis]MBD8007258.1 DUF3955 domain-containing protein [Bacillus norwichensis]